MPVMWPVGARRRVKGSVEAAAPSLMALTLSRWTASRVRTWSSEVLKAKVPSALVLVSKPPLWMR
ncbi:hypothetical protein D3C86_2247610 [compost metagenome]